MSKVYLITTDIGGYDCYRGHIVVANNEKEVRDFALEIVADEEVEAWNTEHSTIEVIADTSTQSKGIILSDFNAG